MIKKANLNWTAKRMSKMFDKGEITFDNVIQRGYVWDDKRKSLLIHSMIMGYPIPAFYAVKSEDNYDMLDGKQRCKAIRDFMNDVYELKDVPDITFSDKEGQDQELNIEKKKFSELPEEVRDLIADYSLTVYWFDDCITDEEIAEMFFRLNNGKPLSAIELTRVRAKSMETIKEIADHELFKSALTAKALERYTNEDIVIKSWVMLHEEQPSLETKYIRPIMESVELEEKDKKELKEIYDRILNAYNILEEKETGKKITKRLLTRTHMISIVPIVWQSLEDGLSDEQFAEWFAQFFNGTRQATKDRTYNNASGAGSAKKEAVKKRKDALEKDYNNYFVSYLNPILPPATHTNQEEFEENIA